MIANAAKTEPTEEIRAMQALLEAAALDADGDIVPAVFDRFFAAFPEARDLFLNIDAAAGRMVNETIEALLGLAEDEWWVETTVINFVDLHRDFGAIPLAQWRTWIDNVVEILIDAAGPGHSEQGAAAWRRQAERLTMMVAAETARKR